MDKSLLPSLEKKLKKSFKKLKNLKFSYEKLGFTIHKKGGKITEWIAILNCLAILPEFQLCFRNVMFSSLRGWFRMRSPNASPIK